MTNKNHHTRKFDKVRIDLSLDACEYLGGITNGIIIWNIYSYLLNLLSQTHGQIVKRGIKVELSPSEIDSSVNSLCEKFDIGPKPMKKVVNRFIELELIRFTPSKLASIADIVSVVGWTNEGGYHELERNPGEQIPEIRDNKSDSNPDDSLPSSQSPSETPEVDPEPSDKPDACPTKTDNKEHVDTGTTGQHDNESLQESDEPNSEQIATDDSNKESQQSSQTQDVDTLYNIHAREGSDERKPEDSHSSEDGSKAESGLGTQPQSQSMTDMVKQLTGVSSTFIIPSVVSVPQGNAKVRSKTAKDGQNKAKAPTE